MFLTTIAALTVTLIPAQSTPLSCPVMGSPAGKGAPGIEYKGSLYRFCCAGCDENFSKDPEKYLKSDANKDKVLGTNLFDPVAGARVTEKTGKGGSSDYKGTRYLFLTAEDKKTFDAAPEKYGAIPDKEALFCPMQKEAIKDFASAGGFYDKDGVRYYTCCTDCLAAIKKDPSITKGADGHIQDAKAIKHVEEKATTGGGGGDKPAPFACKHCGRQIALGSAADMDKTCNVCACGKTNTQCKPGKSK